MELGPNVLLRDRVTGAASPAGAVALELITSEQGSTFQNELKGLLNQVPPVGDKPDFNSNTPRSHVFRNNP